MADLAAGRRTDTLGALLMVVAPDRQGDRLSGLMLETMKAMARLRGLRAVIACVRPTLKERYPQVPIERIRGVDPRGRAARSTPGSGCTCGSAGGWSGACRAR